eukprot:TRINITY_DN21935_c0_g1_i1.p1 TRINITY_DN21935_c0_g1~~TRINITY_DN21935_c0_g1_i1.p1  ORF type:complete len:103 (+),score=1.85 TRINITY_DN21935_c0_g1_i1:128-436(+)
MVFLLHVKSNLKTSSKTWVHKMVKEVASQANDAAGDGTTTAIVLAQSIIAEGLKAVAAGMNPMDLKRGIDKAVIAAVEELKTFQFLVQTRSYRASRYYLCEL